MLSKNFARGWSKKWPTATVLHLCVTLRDKLRGYSDDDLREAHEWLEGEFGWQPSPLIIRACEWEHRVPLRVLSNLSKMDAL